MNKPSQTHFISLKKFVNKTLNVDSLFTNIPLNETIDISIDSLYKDNENTPKIPKNLFRNLLNVPTKESFFTFNNKFYTQIDDAAMRSPLGTALANIFMSNFENKSLKDSPNGFKPVFYRQYGDDIFVLFSSLDQAEKFKKHFSSKQPNINFSLEKKMMFAYLFRHQYFSRKRKIFH